MYVVGAGAQAPNHAIEHARREQVPAPESLVALERNLSITLLEPLLSDHDALTADAHGTGI